MIPLILNTSSLIVHLKPKSMAMQCGHSLHVRLLEKEGLSFLLQWHKVYLSRSQLFVHGTFETTNMVSPWLSHSEDHTLSEFRVVLELPCLLLRFPFAQCDSYIIQKFFVCFFKTFLSKRFYKELYKVFLLFWMIFWEINWTIFYRSYIIYILHYRNYNIVRSLTWVVGEVLSYLCVCISRRNFHNCCMPLTFLCFTLRRWRSFGSSCARCWEQLCPTWQWRHTMTGEPA